MLFKKKEDMPKPRPKPKTKPYKNVRDYNQERRDIEKELFPNERGMGDFTERRNNLKGD